MGRDRSSAFGDDLVHRSPLPASSTGLSVRARKELHFFDRFLTEPFQASGAERYRSLFPEFGQGEFTPSYLRCPWVPPLLRSAVSEQTLVIVLLRDPVERFRSAIRWYQRTKPADPELLPRWSREVASDALWGGMYAHHLSIWARHLRADQMVVLQYEAISEDPVPALERVWSRLGVDPCPIQHLEPSSTTTEGDHRDWIEPSALTEIYRDQVRELARSWPIDPSLWESFS